MTSKTKEQAKTPAKPARSTAGEIAARDLDKVVGGLKKSGGGGPKSGVIDDPCGGGE